MKSKKFFNLILVFLICSCSVIPGMSNPKVNSIGLDLKKVEVLKITPEIVKGSQSQTENYKISVGDLLSIVVFGQEEYFPATQSYVPDSPYSTKQVDERGTIFFPFVGYVEVVGKTVSQVRDELSIALSNEFKNPQVDVSIRKFNEKRNVYVLGEVLQRNTISVGFVPLTLADAISQSGGLSPETSDGSDVFVIRKNISNSSGVVYKADLSSAGDFVVSGQFTLVPGDVVYVGAADITKWNRFVSQLFPFASFINQVDNIEN